MNIRKIIVLVGPTSSGKSDCAVSLARKFGGEIISADSRQVYRGLDIGTGKITQRDMRGIRHHVLDIANPKKAFTAHDFVQFAQTAVEDIETRGKLPIICGGTGFYIDALLDRVPLSDVPTNPKLRARLERKTTEELFALLKRHDRSRASRIDAHNRRRLVRALEIAAARVKATPRQKERFARSRRHLPCEGGFALPGRRRLDSVLWLGISLKSDKLRSRIRARLHARIRHGLISEVKKLHESGLSWKRMNELGLEYRHVSRYLQRQMTKKELVTKLETEIWHYARRQRTYWRKNKEIRWFAGGSDKKILSTVRAFVTRE